MQDITFEGLETTDRRLRELADDLGYVSLTEVTGRHSCEALGRADFSATDLAPYLAEMDPNELGELAEVADLDDPSNEDLARAASRWVRQVAAANMAGRATAKFKVCLWRPKGDALLHSARFLARNPVHMDGDEGDDFPLVAPPAPTIAAPAPQPAMIVGPEERVWSALGDGYTRLIALAQGTYSHIASLQNTAIVVLNGQNQRLQKLVLQTGSGAVRRPHPAQDRRLRGRDGAPHRRRRGQGPRRAGPPIHHRAGHARPGRRLGEARPLPRAGRAVRDGQRLARAA